MYWSTFNVRMYHTVFLVCESDFFWDFFSTWTEVKIEGVRFCEDSEVLWDRPVILGFITKLDWTCVEWKSSFTVSESVFHFGTYERYVCVHIRWASAWDRWLFGCVCVSLSLWSFSLHLEAVPAGGVFLRQRGGGGGEVAERQQRKWAGRRKRRTKKLRGREKSLQLLKYLKILLQCTILKTNVSCLKKFKLCDMYCRSL